MKNPHAVALGRLGGKAGTGKAKARTRAQCQAAARARWDKPRKAVKSHGVNTPLPHEKK